jgi:hypothetical protein
MSSSSAFAGVLRGRLTLTPSARFAAAQIVGTLSRSVRPRQRSQRGLEPVRGAWLWVPTRDPKELDADTLPGAVCGASEYVIDTLANTLAAHLGFGLKCQGCYAGNKDGRAMVLGR